jgi:hypothetical protein
MINSALLIGWLLVLASSVTLAIPAQSINPQQAKQYITEILQQPEFQTKQTQCYWDYQESASSQPTSHQLTPHQPTSQPQRHTATIDMNWIGTIAQLLEILLWIFLGMIIWLFFFYGYRWLEQLKPKRIDPKPTYIPTPRLLNKNQPLISLSPNIPQHVWTLWQTGENQAALSLLYRGTLSILNTRDDLAIQASATENECLSFVKQQQSPELTNYFFQLVQCWQQVAYAQRLPSDTEVQFLCEKWSDYFARNSA